MISNAICILLASVISHLNNKMFKQQSEGNENNQAPYNFSFLNVYLILAKIVINFMTILHAQITLIELTESYVLHAHEDDIARVWVTYQIMTFYLNILSQIVFLLFASCLRFRSSREKEELDGQKRNQQDYLEYVSEDIHWFTFLIMQISIFFFSQW